MAKRTKSLVGLDIDPTGVFAAAVRVNGKISIERAAMTPLEAGIVRDGEITDTDGLAEAIRRLYREHRGLGKQVRVGVANQKIVVRVLDLPPISDEKELDAAVRFHAQDQLPMPLDQAVIDYQRLDVVEGDGGPRQRVLLVAARRDMVDRVLSAVRSAGLRPAGVDLSAFAMIRALYRPGPAEDFVLYLSIGGLTNLAVAKGPLCLFTRASGGGLERLAVELAERKALTLEHSRGWLTHVGMEQPLENVEGDPEIVAETRQVLSEGVRRIAAEIRNSLDYHQGQGSDAAVTRAVLTGPAAAVPGFAAALSSNLGMPVEPGVIEGSPAGVDAAQLTVAAGLALSEVPA